MNNAIEERQCWLCGGNLEYNDPNGATLFAIYAESSKPIEVHQPCLIRALIVAKQEVAEWRSSR